jgi:hypothetical protein
MGVMKRLVGPPVGCLDVWRWEGWVLRRTQQVADSSRRTPQRRRQARHDGNTRTARNDAALQQRNTFTPSPGTRSAIACAACAAPGGCRCCCDGCGCRCCCRLLQRLCSMEAAESRALKCRWQHTPPWPISNSAHALLLKLRTTPPDCAAARRQVLDCLLPSVAQA